VSDREQRPWVPDRDWRVLARDDYKTCRMRGCDRSGVAELNRGIRTSRGKVDSWWAYCSEHLYGRRVEGDRVLVRVHPDSPLAKEVNA